MRHRHDHVLRMLGLLLLLSSGQAQAAAVVERGRRPVGDGGGGAEAGRSGQGRRGRSHHAPAGRRPRRRRQRSRGDPPADRARPRRTRHHPRGRPSRSRSPPTDRSMSAARSLGRARSRMTLGLTVRHALVLAGGLEIADSANGLSGARLIEIRAKWRSSAYQLLQADARIARLRAELGERIAARPGRGWTLGPSATPTRRTVLSLETQQLSDRLAEQAGSKAHLKDVMAQIDLEVDVLDPAGEVAAAGERAAAGRGRERPHPLREGPHPAASPAGTRAGGVTTLARSAGEPGFRGAARGRTRRTSDTRSRPPRPRGGSTFGANSLPRSADRTRLDAEMQALSRRP